MRPFRFGINVRTAASQAEWADKARKVEALGYAVLLVPDHLADLLAPFPALAAAAAATTRLRVGTAVLNNDFRHPALLAREAATLDVLSDGRLELGRLDERMLRDIGLTRSEVDYESKPFWRE